MWYCKEVKNNSVYFFCKLCCFLKKFVRNETIWMKMEILENKFAHVDNLLCPFWG